MATILRAPLITPPRAPKDNLGARQFISVGLALLTAVALPVGKSAGVREPPSIAKKLDSPIARDRQRINDLPRQLAVALPPGKTTSPLPLRIDSPLARDRQRVNDLPRQLQDTFPQGDTCGMIRVLPQRTDSPLARETPPLNIAALNTIVVVQAPFSQGDWPIIEPIRLRVPDTLAQRALALVTAVDLPVGNAAGFLPIPKTVDSPIARQWQRSDSQALATAVDLPVGNAAGFLPVPKTVDSPIARRWERSDSQALPTAVTLPFRLSEWPLPDRAAPAPPESPPLNIAVLNTVVVVEAPFFQTDWQLPGRVVRPPETAVATALALAAQPFGQFDWTLPSRTDSPLARDRQRQNDLARQTAVTLPSQLFDWPLPGRVDSPLARDRQRQNDLARQVAVRLPEQQFDWPLPQRVDSPIARDRQRQNDLARQTAVSLPAQPYDWPLPQRPGAHPLDGASPNVALLNTVVVVTTPFSQLDWPLPDSVKFRPGDTPLGLSLSLTATPFAQFGWTLPAKLDSRQARDWQRANDLGRQLSVILPSEPYDWPLPRGRQPAPPEAAYVNVVPVNTPVVVVVKPFGQLDWPLPQIARPLTSPTSPANLLPATEPAGPKGWLPRRHKRHDGVRQLTEALRELFRNRPDVDLDNPPLKLLLPQPIRDTSRVGTPRLVLGELAKPVGDVASVASAARIPVPASVEVIRPFAVTWRVQPVVYMGAVGRPHMADHHAEVEQAMRVLGDLIDQWDREEDERLQREDRANWKK